MPDNDIRAQAIELLASTGYARLTGLGNSPEGPWGELPEHVRTNWRQSFTQVVDVLVAAGWRPPARVITEAADLDTLPVGTVVMNDGSQIAQRYDGPGVWWQVLDGDQYDSADLIGTGNVTVLHELEEAQR